MALVRIDRLTEPSARATQSRGGGLRLTGREFRERALSRQLFPRRVPLRVPGGLIGAVPPVRPLTRDADHEPGLSSSSACLYLLARFATTKPMGLIEALGTLAASKEAVAFFSLKAVNQHKPGFQPNVSHVFSVGGAGRRNARSTALRSTIPIVRARTSSTSIS